MEDKNYKNNKKEANNIFASFLFKDGFGTPYINLL